jgi:uncharacterized membrane protein
MHCFLKRAGQIARGLNRYQKTTLQRHLSKGGGSMETQSWSTRRLVIMAMLIAISIVLAIPIQPTGPLNSLGFITLGPAIAFTFMHVPAIIGAVIEGPLVGGIVGLAFGIFSLYLATLQPAGSQNAIFVDPIISVLPRIFIGPVAWLIYRALKNAGGSASLIGAAIGGTLTNTILVIGAIAVRLGAPFLGILSSVALNVVIELIVASVIVVAVVGALRGYTGGRTGSSV